jgi:hypothetical protein
MFAQANLWARTLPPLQRISLLESEDAQIAIRAYALAMVIVHDLVVF